MEDCWACRSGPTPAIPNWLDPKVNPLSHLAKLGADLSPKVVTSFVDQSWDGANGHKLGRKTTFLSLVGVF